MVGVCFWLMSFIYLLSTECYAKPKKECLEVCICLGGYIECGSKRFETIPASIPKWATHLDLHNNSIKNITVVDWKSLSNLTVLNLNKNYISTIPKDSFTNQKHLKILELNRNRLTEIVALSFKHLEHLTSLKLKKNEIKLLQDGSFYGLNEIEKLFLDNNEIEVISKGWLYGLESLKELSLSHNRITRINIDAWEFCKNLKSLDLSSNSIEFIETDTFKYLDGLIKLSLSNNSIKIIKENAFMHLSKLETLNVNYNEISWAIEDANGVFRGLNNLRKFFLVGNDIKSINANAFFGLKNVTFINLDNNNITSIQKHAFNELHLLKDLNINTPSLICDCNLEWFVQWLNTKGFKTNTIFCAYPEWMSGKSLFDVATSNFTCDELPKPRLIEEPDLQIMALKGENVSLNCKAMSSSKSIMTFQWKKDNIKIIRSDIIITSRTYPDGRTTETSSQLNLNWVQHSDAGKYQCIVTNRYGTTYSKKSNISVLVYPTFTKIPKNVTVEVGETAKLLCAADGEPAPEIKWHKFGGNNFPAASERRMHVMPSDDEFFIVNAKPIDSGVYSCTAHNPAGTIIANASLTIEEKPYFTKSMEDKEVSAGDFVVLQCMAKGVPPPTITWLKDGAVIVPTERHFFTAEDMLVVIVDTVQSDSGTYECHLNNSLGKVEGYSRIKIKPLAFDNSNMLGIIIITVVSCAVLTSIIWVVIIYQTRRKMSGTQLELQELPEMSDGTIIHPNMPLHAFPDNISDHSSCKDSGTGDSARRSHDDLAPEELFTGEKTNEVRNPLIPPLLYYPLSTNHDRAISIENIDKNAANTPTEV